MNWTDHVDGGCSISVPIELWPGQDGHYHIHIVKRPDHCDRGDWVFLVNGESDVDYADGFPRYFFGTKKQAKQQMETWINRRTAYRNWMNRSMAT